MFENGEKPSIKDMVLFYNACMKKWNDDDDIDIDTYNLNFETIVDSCHSLNFSNDITL